MATKTIELDWRAEDRLLMEGAVSLCQAVGNRKRVARRKGRDVKTIDRWCAGHESSPVYRHDQLLRAVDNPWPLVTHARIVAMRAEELAQMPDADVVRGWWSMTMREHRVEAAENGAVVGGTMAELADADEEEAALQVRRAAYSRELAERMIDPRDPEWTHIRDAVREEIGRAR